MPTPPPPNINTIILALIGIIVPLLYWHSRTSGSIFARKAKARADAMDDLEATVARKDAEIQAQALVIERVRLALEKSEESRIALIGRMREVMETEEDKQSAIRHDLKAEIRNQSTRIHDLETENTQLREMIAALTTRIAALESASH